VFDCLSERERERVGRQRGPQGQARFAFTRIAMRHILAHYIGGAPGAVEVMVDVRGKPALPGAHGIHFSLSHAARVALLAVARTEVGIDIEHLREPRRMLRVAERVLHEDTVTALRRLRGARRQLGFLDAWTQRESHVKAVGGGLFMTPDVLPVDMQQPADGAIHIRYDRMNGEAWSVARFAPAEDARASVVARGRIEHLRFFEWRMNENGSGE
jgi:phosphopantetheinyl transferase